MAAICAGVPKACIASSCRPSAMYHGGALAGIIIASKAGVCAGTAAYGEPANNRLHAVAKRY